jgi:hypothetical protein
VAIAFEALVGPWGMPFFFLLSGASAWLALRHRTARQFLRERVTRLLLPYLVGCLLLTPIQGYYDWKFWSAREEVPPTYLQFMLDRWQGPNPTIFDWLGYHLWFLAFLFCVSLVALPVLRWLRGTAGQRFVARLSGLCQRRGGFLIFLLPLLLIQLGLRPFAPQSYGWSDFVYYLCFFLLGALFVADEGITRAIRRDWWLALVLAVAAFLGLGTIVALGKSEAWFSDSAVPGFYLFWTVATLDTWGWMLLMWFLGMRFLDLTNRWLRWGQELIVPFYVLHQPAIVVLAYYVVGWDVGVTVKMLVIFFGALAITLAIIELLIRRVPPLCRLFGLRAVGAVPGQA